ncbi:hypothetical protein NQ176_g599 [Zarea fungicola]|uniref:Uncharacterized protein n=1 Tax=Zarea fungicola TaxID=93591 RepID=A0ACC1NXF2_9HYPO|nr:hypothetical protein NQ176_g599 [Lecanicillium fungicola]
MQYPCIEVSQLAPSTSFYAALFHPLQLRYLTAESAAAGHGFATFGSSLGPVLELRQVSNFAAVRLSSIRISAPSPTAIEAFCKQGIAANPESVFTAEEDFHQATMFDLDGNRIQVVCAETAHTPEVLTGNFTLILEPTKATHVSRVLDWNHYNPDSTKSTMARVSYALTASDESRPPGSSEQTLPKDTKPVEIKSPNEGGISAVFGALLGVAAGAAAGAAITYGVMAAKTPTAVPLRLESSRPRGLPTDSQRPVATSISTGLIEREPHKTPPLRTQYITFEEEKSSTRKSSSSRPAASVTERRAVPGHSNSTDRDIGKNSDTQVVRVSRDVEITGRKHRSKSSISNSMKSTQTSRRITLPSAENSDSMANEKAIEIQILEAEQKASVSDKSAQSPSSRNQVLTPKRIAEHKSSISSTSAKNHQRGKDLKPLNSGQGRSEDTISHQRSSGQNLGQNLSDGRLSMTQLPPVRGTSQASAPNFLLSPTGADAGECPDKVSHVSARKKDLPHSQVENSLTEDDHSHISARQFSFPPSEAGTSRLLDTVSHASKKVTRLRASHIKNGTVTHNSNVENTHSHVSARNSPLHSDTGNDTSYFSTTFPASP